MQPAIGILIPTFNRMNELREALARLERQTCRDFEVVVVDDGSADDTRHMVESYSAGAPFPLLYLHQENSGQATARNLGIRHMTAPICLMIGDDIFAAPDLARLHLDLHRAHPEPNAVAVGLTRWSEDGQIVTPFMRWLEEDGVQFAYAELLGGTAPSWKHFYTSNLSAKTAYLLANPFEQSFRNYGIEDIELGYRLAKERDLRMYFLPHAVAWHLHSTTFAQSCKRATQVGRATFEFGQLWPEQRLLSGRTLRMRMLLRLIVAAPFALTLIDWVAGIATGMRCPNALMKLTLWLHVRQGYAQAEAAAQAKAAR